MSVVSDITNLILYDICEDPPIGPILGLISMAQILDLLNLTLIDYAQRTCIISQIQTQTVSAGTSRYVYPDSMMRVDLAFLAGILLEPTTVQALNNGTRNWRTQLGLPTRFHADELPLKTVELVLVPNDTGVYIDGPNEPDPPHAQLGSFNITSNAAVLTPLQHRDLTLIGPQMPATVALTTDPICFGSVASPTALFPSDIVIGFLEAGVMARILSSDSELKSDFAAEWFLSEYMEGVAVMAAIMGEISDTQ
jgi:hypothetical protein